MVESNCFSFDGFTPVIKASAFIHPNAQVIGNVIVGEDVYIGPGAVLRGDWGKIEVQDGSNVQENCVIHMFPGKAVVLRENSHIGHGAIIHGGDIGENSLIGMNAVIMDDVLIGKESIIGALCFVPAKMKIPSRSLVVGNPAKIIKQVSDQMITWKTKGTELYQTLPKQCETTLKPCKPLREIESDRKKQKTHYIPWKS